MPPFSSSITVNGTGTGEDLRAISPAASPTVTSFLYTLNGLGGNDRLFAINGPSNWPSFAAGYGSSLPLLVRNELYGGEGNDILVGAKGFAGLSPTLQADYTLQNYLVGGDGDDTYILQSHPTTVVELTGGGTDRILINAAYLSSLAAALASSDIPDLTVTLADYDEVENMALTADTHATAVNMSGNDLNNRLSGNNSANIMYGGVGDDRLEGFGGDDEIHGDGGNDRIQTGSGSNTAYGGDGEDRLIGQGSNDYLYGGIGDDIIFGLASSGTYSGGEDYDTYFIDSLDDVVVELGGQGQDTVWSSAISLNSANYANVEVLRLGGSADLDIVASGSNARSFIGNSGNNLLDGSAGNDIQLRGGDGNDTLLGSAGGNYLFGGNGDDSMVGGLGNDFYVIDSFNDIVVELVGGGNDTLAAEFSMFGNFLPSGFGNFEALELLGSANDGLEGGTGIRSLTGNSGDNYLYGSNESEEIFGGAGNDELQPGGRGTDYLTGGDGVDTFQMVGFFDNANSTILINDFDATQELIDLKSAGSGIAEFNSGGAFSGGGVSSVYTSVSWGDTFIYLDYDGDGMQDFVFSLFGEHTLTSANFLLSPLNG